MRSTLGLTACVAVLLVAQGCGGSSGEPTSANAQAPGTAAPAPVTPPPAPPAPGTPAPPSSTNDAPTISGSPATQITVGSQYSFTPQASDPEGAGVTFSIENKPGWATFDTSTGALTGAPATANIGQFANVRISATDGTHVASLAPFSIAVAAPGGQVATGSATLSWTPPTERTDGAVLANLTGYKIYYGTTPDSYSQSVTIANAGLTRYVVENLSAGRWYFVVTAYDAAGAESAHSNAASKSIG